MDIILDTTDLLPVTAAGLRFFISTSRFHSLRYRYFNDKNCIKASTAIELQGPAAAECAVHG